MARIAFVDLNSFALYPTMSAGYLIAVLRRAGHTVRLISPLELGVTFHTREPRMTWKTRWEERLTFDQRPWVVRSRRAVGRIRTSRRRRQHDRIAQRATEALDQTDVILVSTYLEHRPCCESLGRAARARGVPMIVGGPMFSVSDVADAWMDLPGLSALVTVEGESLVAGLVQAALNGGVQPGPGVRVPGAPLVVPATPSALRLDDLPFPDYDDFPWDRYPHRCVPVLASRGCAWGVCQFCSDVVTANGLVSRARSSDSVLDEMEYQARRYDTRDFLFLDLKLNGSARLWDGLLEGIPRRIPGARWAGAVHVGDRPADTTLTPGRLAAAAEAGLVRVTTGLESGSQRLLDAMGKGTSIARTERFLQDAYDAGISVRGTLMVGYPEDTPADLDATADFLQRNRRLLGRLRIARFHLQTDTLLDRRLRKDATGLDGTVGPNAFDPGSRRLNRPAMLTGAYRRALWRLLRLVHAINDQPLPENARVFEGAL